MTRHKISEPQPELISAGFKQWAWQCPFCERRSNFGHTRESALKGGRDHLWTYHGGDGRLHLGSL